MGISKNTMKVALFSVLISFAAAKWQIEGRGPRPRPIPIDPNSNPKDENQKSGTDDRTCSIRDYKNHLIDSWFTNCPDSCHIMDYINEVGRNLNVQWDAIAKKIEGKLSKSGAASDYHLTLQQIIIKLQEILNSLMTEKEKFDEIEKLYASGDIPGILARQSIKVNELSTKRVELQQKLVALKKGFIEQTGFCKVSFKEYDEMVCDIISHATGV